jgi:hypothetical protein
MEHGLYHEAPARPLPCGALLHLLKQAGDAPDPDTGIVEKEDAGAEERRHLVCRTCGTVITRGEWGIEVNGAHRHTFMNPGGIVFLIGCFSEAGGCYVLGAPTNEYTWFAGYAWRYVVCAGCLSHLGWHYRAGEAGFFGLTLDQLAPG